MFSLFLLEINVVLGVLCFNNLFHMYFGLDLITTRRMLGFLKADKGWGRSWKYPKQQSTLPFGLAESSTKQQSTLPCGLAESSTKLSQPKFNQQISSTEFEVRLHSYTVIHHPPPQTLCPS